MIHSASPQPTAQQWVSLDFEVLGRTDGQVKIVILYGRDCGRPRGSITSIFFVPSLRAKPKDIFQSLSINFTLCWYPLILTEFVQLIERY